MTSLEVKRIRLMIGMSLRDFGKAIGLGQSGIFQIESGLIPAKKHEEKIKQVLREHIEIKKAAMEEEIAFLESLLK